jgi:SAM-dependent methyltransferase
MAKEFTREQLEGIRVHERYPRSSKYDPEWVYRNSVGSQCLWLTESLTQKVDLRPGQRVLDLGCGKALSSVFLAKEFGVQVWAVDLQADPTSNWKMISEAGVGNLVFPVRADARSLPFARGFFDAVISINAYWTFGTDDFFASARLAPLLLPGTQVGLINPGVLKEYKGEIPAHVKPYWLEHVVAYHSPDWWRRHFERTGLFDVLVSDGLDDRDGITVWQRWAGVVTGDDTLIINDRGQNISFLRTIVRRNEAPAG